MESLPPLAEIAALDGLTYFGLFQEGADPTCYAGEAPKELLQLAYQLVQTQRALLRARRTEEPLDELIAAGSRTLVICRPRQGEPNQCWILIAQSRTNLALARLLLSRYEQAAP